MSTIPVGLIRGFLIPTYTDPRTNQHTFDSPADFEKVRLGYACACCLAEFTTYMPVCPLCRNERDVAADLRETPADLQAYYDEANGPGERTVARSMEETIRELIGSGEVEQVPLRGLRPSRFGRG